MKTKQIQLKYRPKKISSDCFKLVESKIPALKKNQVLVENLYMSVDPYMRLSMEDGADLEAWKLNSALDGPSVGIVVDSKNKKFKEGDIVESMSGWQEHFISEGDEFIPYVSSNTAIKKRISFHCCSSPALNISMPTGICPISRIAFITRSLSSFKSSYVDETNI